MKEKNKKKPSSPKKSPGRLTGRQKCFAEAYVEHKDLMRAYRKAGYKGRNGNERYARNIFEKPQVQKKIEELLRGRDTGISLTERERVFAEEYVSHGDGKKAFIVAGYAKSMKDSGGWRRMLDRPHLSAHIKVRQRERATRTALEADYVVDRLREVVEKSLGHKPILSDDALEEMNRHRPPSRQLHRKFDFRPGPASEALELLGKHLAMFTDNLSFKGEITTKSGVLLIPGTVGSMAEWQEFITKKGYGEVIEHKPAIDGSVRD